MGEQLRAQPAAAAAASSCSRLGGLLHAGRPPPGQPLANGGCGEAPHPLLLRTEPPSCHGSPAKKCRLRRRRDSGRRHRPRKCPARGARLGSARSPPPSPPPPPSHRGRSEAPAARPMRRRPPGTAPPCANGAAAGGERRPRTNAGGGPGSALSPAPRLGRLPGVSAGRAASMKLIVHKQRCE